MSTTRHCQGCGATEGSPRVVHKKKDTTVRLTKLAFLDYGDRLFCQNCKGRALRLAIQIIHRQHHTTVAA
jgi:hypothetical protein